MNGAEGSCPGRGAALLAVHRRAGIQKISEWTPDQQRTAKGAALHPGNAGDDAY
jgi:hypothetical protein